MRDHASNHRHKHPEFATSWNQSTSLTFLRMASVAPGTRLEASCTAWGIRSTLMPDRCICCEPLQPSAYRCCGWRSEIACSAEKSAVEAHTAMNALHPAATRECTYSNIVSLCPVLRSYSASRRTSLRNASCGSHPEHSFISLFSCANTSSLESNPIIKN